MSGDNDKGYLLAIVLDINPTLAKNEKHIEEYFNAVIAYSNLHLASNANNKLVIIGATHSHTSFLYPKENETEISRQTDGRLEMISQADETIRKEICRLVNSASAFSQIESLLAGAMDRALLYIRRIRSEMQLVHELSAKIVIVKNSTDSSGQYLNYINMFLAAQKLHVPIDACLIGSDSGLLQQGADITSGYYSRIEKVEDLLQTLIMLYLPDIKLRNKLSKPPKSRVDYRAACFCHRTLVDVANVCSNCMSVYCKAVPLCSTCNAFFKVDMPLKKNIRKKK